MFVYVQLDFLKELFDYCCESISDWNLNSWWVVEAEVINTDGYCSESSFLWAEVFLAVI